MNKQDIIEENGRRRALREQPFEPLIGTEHSPNEIPRVSLCIPDAPLRTMYIPKEMDDEALVKMLRKFGSFKALLSALGKEPSDMFELWTEFEKLRCKYDFEYWCAVDVKILHKTKMQMMPFILNRPQRMIYLPHLERMRKSGMPINVVLLKARQWGGSTLTEFYIVWIQRFWCENFNSAICADVDDQAKNILGMYERAVYDMDIRLNDYQSLEMKPYMGMESTRYIESRGCCISVGSAQHPDKIRSQNLRAAHLTEVGLWKDTPKKKAADVVQSFFGTIMNLPYTMKVLESTAKGVGNFFHSFCLKSRSKLPNEWNGFQFVFVSWFDIDIYQLPIDDYVRFIDEMDEYDEFLWLLGATLEGINWYKQTLQTMTEPWRMKSEFPSTPEEAFQSTGRNFFANEHVERMRQNCMPPKMLAEISGDERSGVLALENVHISEESNGRFKIWEMPDTDTKMANRYLVVVDLGKGQTDKADNSIIVVFDRYWCHEPDGMPEVVAEWSGHMDVDLIAWKAAQVAKAYGDALLVIESNTAETSNEERIRVVLAEIGEHYENIYRRKKADKQKGGFDRYGFHTNVTTKKESCEYLQKALRDGLYIERNEETINEMRVFERKPNGVLGAVDGNHDDRVMTRAIACYFFFREGMMDIPRFITETNVEESVVDIEIL